MIASADSSSEAGAKVPAAPALEYATPPRPAKSARSGSLDGLRALAVLAVMGVHVGFPLLHDVGGLGVDLFFVLSGFLITTLLIKERKENGRINLSQFWARRFLRLMPAYWFYLAIVMVIFACTYDRSQTTTATGWTPELYITSLWGYFANYAPQNLIWGTHRAEEFGSQFLTLHLWSLSVEEQFYFVWPFLMGLALIFKRGWLMPWIIVGGILTYRIGGHFAWWTIPGAGMDSWLYTRGIGIVLGSATAYYLSLKPVWLMKLMESKAVRWGWALLTILALLGTMAVTHIGWLKEEDIKAIFVPGFDLLFAGIVAGLWFFPGGAIARFLAWKPLAYIGAISYGLYLYHMLAQRLTWNWLLTEANTAGWPGWMKSAGHLGVFFVLSFGIAILSYHFLEQPFLRLKDRFRAGEKGHPKG